MGGIAITHALPGSLRPLAKATPLDLPPARAITGVVGLRSRGRARGGVYWLLPDLRSAHVGQQLRLPEGRYEAYAAGSAAPGTATQPSRMRVQLGDRIAASRLRQ